MGAFRGAIAGVAAGLLAIACSEAVDPFASFQQEAFAQTTITATQEKIVRFANPRPDEAQHISAIGFDAGGNEGGHFAIKKVVAGGREYGMKDVVVPGGGVLEITFAYAPRNLTTTRASWGGVETGQPTRYEPQTPKTAVLLLGGKAAAVPEATHRALVVLTYNHPEEGVIQIELVGRAVPGPNGEISAGGGGTAKPGECVATGTTACFTGRFGIELPGLMKGGAAFADLSGPMAVTVDGASAELDMTTFPPVLFVVKGNGPGEPLEGKPIGAISIVISGAPDVVATGTFDGSSLQLNDVAFRIRLYLAEMTLADADTTTAPVDFLVSGLQLGTAEPLADGTIVFHIETTLGTNPSANPLVDPFLSGAKVVVTMEGTLQVP